MRCLLSRTRNRNFCHRLHQLTILKNETNSASKLFLYQTIREIRDWKLLTILKAQKDERLPEIPAQETIRKILSCVTTFHNFVFFSTVYACGLRLQEALNIHIPDIDGTRMMLYAHRGKGAKDRYVPIPQETLLLLRTYCKKKHQPATLEEHSELFTHVVSDDIKDEIKSASHESAAISAALGIERNAYELYTERAEESDYQIEKDLYKKLAIWERDHIKFLSELNRKIIQSAFFDGVE